MNRRIFLTGLTTALAAVRIGNAQTAMKKAVVGVLGSTPVAPQLYEMFKRGVRELGYTEDHDVTFVQRDAADTPERLPALAAEFVRSRADVIFARGPVAVAASAKASKTIPIVAIDLESDPIALGYAKTLAQPGGNVTGVFMDLPELSAKQLQLFREIVPRLSRVALVGDSTGNAAQLRATERAAASFGINVETFEGRTFAELDAALRAARRAGVEAVVIFSSPTVFSRRTHLASLGLETRLATVSLFTEFAEAGGLLTYGPNLREAFRRSGIFVTRILKGEKPGNLPIERPEKFELVINLKTAKALGLTVPPSLLLRADQIIE
jgi:putative tryptophan/tyrosine transport system substrate-binding protein